MNTLSEFLGIDDFNLEEYISDKIESFQEQIDVNYTIYIPSKGRSKYGHTIQLLQDHGISKWFVVVEPQDFELYSEKYGKDKVLMLDKNDQGISYARSFIKNYSKSVGETFHWQIDDDMKSFRLRINNKNEKVDTKNCLSIVEQTVNKFSNIGIAGITHFAFAFSKKKQISMNRMAYGCVLINNTVPCEWRSGTNEDLDYSLQTLEAGYCILPFNKVLFDTFTTGTLEGGNMLNLFEGEGRKEIYEKTADLWPGRFIVKELDSNRGWTLKHTRRFYDDYKQRPMLKD